MARKRADVKTTSDERKTNTEPLTHAYVHWLADVHSGSFAPAFTLSFHDSERSRKPPMPIASVVSGYSKKNKNMYKALIFCTLILLISCTGQQKETKKSVTDNVVRKDTIAVNDTLREPYHYYYLADISPREFAELIMKDSVRPSDNFSTFRVMDSLNAKSLEDRKFYFKVFLNIMKKSDGAIAEAVGSPAYDYAEKHTKEFFELSQAITKEQFELWANNVGVEIYLSSQDNPTKEAEEYYKKLQENCSPDQKNEVDKFYRFIKKAIADCDKN